MTARQLRRAKEHQERKLARKAALAAANANPAAEQNLQPSIPISQAKLDANRTNAQSSTGPRTEERKAIAALNNLRHGFNGVFCVLPSESSKAFIRLADDLVNEHQPATPTERLLVMDMARHYWLLQRAIRLQEETFTRTLDDEALAKQLALYMRYQTTNQRAFHRCLHDLLKLRKQSAAGNRGFESQKAEQAPQEPETGKPDSNESAPEVTNVQRIVADVIVPVGFESQNALNDFLSGPKLTAKC